MFRAIDCRLHGISLISVSSNCIANCYMWVYVYRTLAIGYRINWINQLEMAKITLRVSFQRDLLLKNKLNLSEKKEDCEKWKMLCNFAEIDYEKSRDSKIAIICEAINKISTAIYQFSFYCLNLSYKKTKKFGHILNKIFEYT